MSLVRWLTLVVLTHVVALGVGVGAYAQQPVGWFRADKLPSLEDAYDERFEALAIGEEGGPCEAIAARQGDATHPLMVLVPGIGGDGDEMQAALPEVMKARPASVYMFRYRAAAFVYAAQRIGDGTYVEWLVPGSAT
ncbi:MAG: hypothetical protein JNK82_38545 [Myxococcaceae bacterium]|nr:hypothetical protein [Myxococcaceae bacterium]